jgi:isopentenyl diphosphate isomerase/L-lactate dehydrogenase-like FMN-dependent dehydrogenase
MTIPPTLTPGTILNALPRPAWWFNFLTTEPLAFASLNSWSGTVAELLDTMFDPTVTYADLTWIKEQWPGKLVVKGIQSVDDARRVTDVGADGLILSNHGCRQLDRAPVPFHLLPEVVREVGHDTEVMLDTGIMNGADIVAACALGARFTLVGRAYLYGLMAGEVPRATKLYFSQASTPAIPDLSLGEVPYKGLSLTVFFRRHRLVGLRGRESVGEGDRERVQRWLPAHFLGDQRVVGVGVAGSC